MTFLRRHAQIIGLTSLIFVFWNTQAMWPLKVLVVLFHEIAHGFAAIATGGSIEKITITANEGGTAWTRGGNAVAITSAGYLGSLFFGVILFFAAIRSNADRVVAVTFGAMILAVVALYIRDGFAAWFAFATGAALVCIGLFLPRAIADLVLRVVGLATMIYAPYDIISDTLLRSIEGSDAHAISHQLGGSPRLWGVIWLGISLVTIALALRFGLKGNTNIGLIRTRRPDIDTDPEGPSPV